ncbi:MAG: HEAT repeat domain-containing protein [Armatimonadia bacterium]
MPKDLEPGIGDLLKFVAGEIKAAAEGQMSPSLPLSQRRQQSLLRMLKSGDEPVQWIAIKELGQIGGPEAAGELMPFMTSPNEDLRAAARDSLAQIEKRAGMAQQQAPTPPPPLPGTPVVRPRAKPGTGAPRVRLEMPAPVETEVELRGRTGGTTPSEEPPSSPSPVAPVSPQAKPGTGAPRVRLEMPAAVETEQEVRARRSDSTQSQERRAQEVRPPGAAPVAAPPSAQEEQRTAGDRLLPMLINREQSMLPPMAEASQTSAGIPPMAEMETSAPAIPDMAEMPPI